MLGTQAGYIPEAPPVINATEPSIFIVVLCVCVLYSMEKFQDMRAFYTYVWLMCVRMMRGISCLTCPAGQLDIPRGHQ